jgi:hypothetical protein
MSAGHVAHGGGDLREGLGGVGHEVALEQQVARRIAADDQLREYHEVGALGDERGVGVENLAAVAGKIADGRVELGETDAHGSGIKEPTWRGFGGMTTPRLAPGATPPLPRSLSDLLMNIISSARNLIAMEGICLDRLLKERSALHKSGIPFDFPPQSGESRSLSGGTVCIAAVTTSGSRTLIQSPTNSHG